MDSIFDVIYSANQISRFMFCVIIYTCILLLVGVGCMLSMIINVKVDRQPLSPDSVFVRVMW